MIDILNWKLTTQIIYLKKKLVSGKGDKCLTIICFFSSSMNHIVAIRCQVF